MPAEDAGEQTQAPALPPVRPPESFARFAEQCEVRMTAEPLCVAPRDVLIPIDEVDQHFLVSLARAGADAAPVRLVFRVPVSTRAEPMIEDVLWWVAGDAWAIAHCGRSLNSWAATYGYPPHDEATTWLFEQASRQSAALATLLGDSDMQRLLALYEEEIGPLPPR